MKRNIIITVFLFFIILIANGQDKSKAIVTGVYGLYADVSTYKELAIFENNTFTYIDRFELGSSFKCSGKWKIEKKNLILYDCENNINRPMPVKWKISDRELCSKEKRKYNYCLSFAKNHN
jgi:hypothetical protein